jgi:dihydropteroate synthase
VVQVIPTFAVAGLPQPGRTLVVGVVNVTPDSFSDGGRWFDPDAAVAHGLDLLDQGADIIDVGGESTRPGAVRPPLAEELRRVMSVVPRLVEAGAVVSVDTMRTAVVDEAVDAGAKLVNDVSGGQADPQMFATIARLGVPYVCMHWRGHSAQMQSRASYLDVVSEVVAELRHQVGAAVRAGIDPDQLILDPGVGFAKTGEHNWQLLHRFDEFAVLGRPLLVGVSRKAFLGTLLPDRQGSPRPPNGRDGASTALTVVLAQHRVWGIRVHSVRASRDAIAVVQRLAQG